MRRTLKWIPGLLVAAAWAPAWGQQQPPPAPAPPPSPAVQETATLAEQIGVLKALNPLSLSAEQIQAVLDILKPGLQKLKQQDQANAKQMAAVIPQLRQTVLQPHVAPAQTSPAELEYHRLQQVTRLTRDQARAQLRDQLRAAMEKLITPAQHDTLLAEGKVLYIQQRLQDSAATNRGSVEATARTLDQLRQTDAQSYPNERQNFAMRTADIPNVAQFGGRGGPGGNPGGGPGGGNFRGRGGRGGQGNLSPDQQQRLQQLQEQAQQQLNDPAVQARLRQYLMLADQIRSMPQPTYQQQRSKLALQIWQAREQQRVQTRPQDAVDAFINQVLLAPSAPEVLEAKLKQTSAG